MSPQEIETALARAGGRLGPFGRPLDVHAELPSTNDRAASLAEAGVPEGCLVVAGSQTAGRGRRGRSWCSPPGAGLYASVVLRPEARVVPLLTIAAGVALADGIHEATGLDPTLKWPNDVQAGGGRKLAGILAESGAAPGGAPHVVVGFGINIRPAAYPADVAARATSLEAELGRPVDGAALLAHCLAAFAARYDDLRNDRAAAVLAAWRGRARPLLGRVVEWSDRGEARRGTAHDVDEAGALIVRTTEGTARVISGEVRWI